MEQFEAFLLARQDAESQMDEDRGQRIKTLREQRHLSQPAIVEGLEKLAGEPIVTLRGYQTWEAGGGIRWEKLKVLAAYHEVDPEYIQTGRERPSTPDPFAREGETQLDRIEAMLIEALALLKRERDLTPSQRVAAEVERTARRAAQQARGESAERSTSTRKRRAAR